MFALILNFFVQGPLQLSLYCQHSPIQTKKNLLLYQVIAFGGTNATFQSSFYMIYFGWIALPLIERYPRNSAYRLNGDYLTLCAPDLLHLYDLQNNKCDLFITPVYPCSAN